MQTKVLNYRVIIEPETYPDEKRVYNAYCPALGVTDYGDSVEEVLESMKDGILLAIKTLVNEGKSVPVDKLEEQILTSTKVTIPVKLKNAFI